jgi:hypothetical protein
MIKGYAELTKKKKMKILKRWVEVGQNVVDLPRNLISGTKLSLKLVLLSVCVMLL